LLQVLKLIFNNNLVQVHNVAESDIAANQSKLPELKLWAERLRTSLAIQKEDADRDPAQITENVRFAARKDTETTEVKLQLAERCMTAVIVVLETTKSKTQRVQLELEEGHRPLCSHSPSRLL
jgi:lauroyl/myristoyl acyltransferase